MKEQCKSVINIATLEEGLQQEKQEYISKFQYNNNCVKQCIRYIKLILLLELMLSFGWGCYMILQSYHFQVTENKVINITSEMYLPVSEVQKSHQTAQMPIIFAKSEIITDKLNNFLEDVKLTKEQDKSIVTDVDDIIQTSMQSSISMLSNNMVKANDINNLPVTSLSEDSVYDEEFMKNLMLSKISSSEYIDNIITDKNKDSINYKQFLEKLQNIAKSIAINDLEQFENRHDFTKDIPHLILNNQKDSVSDTSNEIKSLGLDVTTTLNFEDSIDLETNFRNSLQDRKQRFFDLIEDAIQDDHDEKNSSRNLTDEQVNASLELGLVICPPASYEFFDTSLEHSIESTSTSESVSRLEILKQIKNILSDDDAKNKDKQNADDSNMLMSALFDVSTSGNNEHSASDTWMSNVQNTQNHHSSEMSTNQEEEKYKLIKNIQSSFNSEFLQPKIQDIESSTPNVIKFQWFIAPSFFADLFYLPLQHIRKDISELIKTQNSSLGDIIENIEEIILDKDKSYSQCQFEIKMIVNKNVLKITCPAIMFDNLDMDDYNDDYEDDKEWNFDSSNIHAADFSNVSNFKDYFNFDTDESEQPKDELISNENSDIKVTNLQHNVPKVIDKVDEEKIRHEISFSFTTISSDTVDFNKEWNPHEDSDMQQTQLKVTEKQESLNSENAETFLENNEFIALEKKLTSIFGDKILNHMKQQYLRFKDDFPYDIYLPPYWSSCSDSRQLCDDLKKFFGYTFNHKNPYDIYDDYA